MTAPEYPPSFARRAALIEGRLSNLTECEISRCHHTMTQSSYNERNTPSVRPPVAATVHEFRMRSPTHSLTHALSHSLSLSCLATATIPTREAEVPKQTESETKKAGSLNAPVYGDLFSQGVTASNPIGEECHLKPRSPYLNPVSYIPGSPRAPTNPRLSRHIDRKPKEQNK